METHDRWGTASLDPRDYGGDHWTLLYTKHISCGPFGFKEDDF